MTLNPGNNTVTFYYQGVATDRLHYFPSGDTQASSSTQVSGCLMQPITETDKVADTAYAEATDKCIAPANVTTEAASADSWYIQFNGDSFRILGTRPIYTTWGVLDHVSFMCKYEEG